MSLELISKTDSSQDPQCQDLFEPALTPTRKYKVEVALGIIGSLTFSVLIIFVNKYLVQSFNFYYMATLTGWHVASTGFIIHVSVKLGLISAKVTTLLSPVSLSDCSLIRV